MKPINGCSWLAALLIVPAAALAQTEVPQTAATAGPPVQRISTATALSTEQLGSITSVRELPDGRVLVNDGTRRRLLLMDTTLRTVEVVLDSLSEIANTYGTRPAALIPFRGDTTLFVDPASYAIVVIDPAGKPVRVRSVWKVQEIGYYTSSTGMYGWPGVDSKGRIVYRIPAQPAPPRVRPPAGVPYIPSQPDSAFIIAVDLDTRMADTLGYIRIPRSEMVVRQSGEGFFFLDQAVNPMPSTDEWALLPDGTVAFVRWRDYRVEYRTVDGTVTSSGKLPFEWQRITDDDKQRMVDSVRAVQQKNARNSWISSIIRWVNLYNRDYPVGFTIPDDYVPTPGFAKDWIFPTGMKFPENYMYACPPGVEPNSAAIRVVASGNAPATGAARTPPCVPAPVMFGGGTAPPVPTLRPITVMGAAEMPDYRPPIGAGSVRADAEGNLWIRTNPPKPVPGPVYDIVSRQGELVNRLQLPPGYTLVGFGKDKVVYLSMRDASGIHLARIRLR